ncbi:MAG: transporter substrate-binding domain-containing protein [Lachnospiraceae bacterium]|nr:transporter substrate-binding domain-containing protein [Lachnospiraceae bacterium]
MEKNNKKKNAAINKRIILFCIFFFVLVAGLSIFWFFLNNSRMNKEPAVEFKADNTYEKTLYAVTDKDYRPFSYIRPDGSYAGMDVELIAEVANRLNMNLELELMDWDDAQEKIKKGEADVILNMERDRVTEDSGLIASIPVEEKEYVAYGRDRISFIGELYGKRIGSMQLMPELGLTEEIEYISTYREMFEKLEAGELDYIFCPIQVGDTFLRQMKLDDIVSSYAVKEMFGCIALREDKTELRDRINEVLREMHQQGVIQKLDGKWIVHYENTTLSGMLRNHPAIFIVVIASILLMIMFAVVGINDARHLKIQEGYTEELKEKVLTIERQNEELEIEKHNAEAADKAKSTFLFNMSHDIRTPLNAIIGSASIAEKKVNEPEQVLFYLDRISHAGKGLMMMFNDVLDMAQFEVNKMELHPEQCDLSVLVPGLTTIMGEEAKKKEQEFTVTTEHLTCPMVLCDSGRLTQILINIISNAIKFTPEQGHISVTLEQMKESPEETGVYEFRVKDDGPGIDPEFKEHMFSVFEREKNSTQSGKQGTGLGLAIVKRLTDLMEGDIIVNSAPGEGTEVTIRLKFPVIACTAEDDEGTTDEDRLKGKRVLIVEDIEINRSIVEMILMEYGCKADSAENGAIAVDKVKDSGDDIYDLILMDIQMPVMDGYEATRRIRAMSDARLSGIPIIAVTANSSADDRKTAEESGMNDVVPKPIDPKFLKETMLRFL